jgi:hypothetical protein
MRSGINCMPLLFYCPLPQLRSQKRPKLSEEAIPHPLDMKRFGNLQHSLILELVGGRLHLKSVRIRPIFPKPVRRAELNEALVQCRNSRKGVPEDSPAAAVLEAESDVGDPVSYRPRIAARDGLEALRVLIRGADEVSVAALQGEAVRERGETGNDVHDRLIDAPQIQRRESFPPVLGVSGILNELPWFGERLQWR